MEVVIIAGIATLILPVAGLAALFAGVVFPQHEIFSPTDVLKEPFSAERYCIMARLLDKADESFISSHPGCTRKMKTSFRKTRVAIFHGYVQLLAEDFNRTCKAIKLCMITSDMDRSELARAVIKQQFSFAAGMVYVKGKLILYSLGWDRVDASGLVDSLDAMRARLQTLSATVAPNFA